MQVCCRRNHVRDEDIDIDEQIAAVVEVEHNESEPIPRGRHGRDFLVAGQTHREDDAHGVQPVPMRLER